MCGMGTFQEAAIDDDYLEGNPGCRFLHRGFAMRILLLGGSKSGKSGLAQRLARDLSEGNSLYYWATMEPTDEEDRARIRRHLADRAGWGFQTVERGRDLPGALHRLDSREVCFWTV